MLVARSGPTMMARIGVLQALHRNEVPQLNPNAKERHWGKRKLKRINETAFGRRATRVT